MAGLGAIIASIVANVRNALVRPRDGVVGSKREDGLMVWEIV